MANRPKPLPLPIPDGFGIRIQPGYNAIVNYANRELVGHTGKLEAEVDTMDAGLQKITEAIIQAGGQIQSGSNQGNIEPMLAPGTKQRDTANLVPPAHADCHKSLLDGCILADSAPAIPGMQQPVGMTGRSPI